MIRIPLIILMLIMLAVPVSAEEQFAIGSVPVRDITITPGEPWQMVVQFRIVTGIPVESHGNHYLAVIGSGAPLADGLLARMYLESSTLNPSAILMSLTPQQTTALAGKSAGWSLVYIPDLGPAMLICRGKVKVTTK